MSDSQAYEEVTVSSEGVTVTKRFEADEFPVPAIAFEFESNRDEEVTVRLTDTVPDNIEVEDLGFHPEYGSEYWTIDDDTITFERVLGAGASYTTVYGIRATGSDNIQQFLAEPTLEDVDPPLPDDVVPESGDDVIKNAIAGDGEIPGLEDEQGEESDEEDVATLDLKDPSEPESEPEPTPASTGTGRGDTDGATPTAIEEDSLIAAMATEIREKNVSAEDVKLLRQAFEIAAQEGGSTAAKIEQIQSDVADLRAYTGSLEEFLDENGTAQQMLDDFEGRIEAFDRQLEEFESNIEANNRQLSSIDDELGSMRTEMTSVSEEVDSVSEEVDSVSEEVDSVSEEVDSVSEEVESVGQEVDSVSEEVDSVGQEVDSVSEEVESVGQEVDSVGQEVDSVSDDVEALDEEVVSVRQDVDEFGDDIEDFESTIADIEETIGELEEKITDGDVAARITDIEESVEDLKEWQEQIKQTFGG